MVDTTNPARPVLSRVITTSTLVGTVTGFLDVTVDAAGTRAVFAMGTAGIGVLDLTNPAAPIVPLGGFGGTAYGVALDGTASVVYVADGSGGIKVISLANPYSPTLVGGLAMPGIQRGIALSGKTVYVADNLARLVTVDVTDPTAPRQLGSFGTGRFVFHITVDGAHNRVFLIDTTSSADYLDIIDVSNPAAPTRLSATA